MADGPGGTACGSTFLPSISELVSLGLQRQWFAHWNSVDGAPPWLSDGDHRRAIGDRKWRAGSPPCVSVDGGTVPSDYGGCLELGPARRHS